MSHLVEKYHKDIIPMLPEYLYINASTISGCGVFSTKIISEGDIVLRFGGTLCSDTERYSENNIPSTSIYVGDTVILCETCDSKKDISDYINHSCSPNIGFLDAITLVAIRDIPVGTELVSDYSFWEGDVSWCMKSVCRCGSPNCRKRIYGGYWKEISSEHPLFRYYSPFLRRRILGCGKEI